MDVKAEIATDESLQGFGKILHSPDDITVEKGNFEIVPWPHTGWRKLDPNTGDEAGTTEGEFRGAFHLHQEFRELFSSYFCCFKGIKIHFSNSQTVWWEGDYFRGKNLAIATTNNTYLDGLGARPEEASPYEESCVSRGNCIFLWMSDFHPDGGQLFWNLDGNPFTVCLGPNTVGDDVTPGDMRAFHVPAGKGVYFHPGTWHNGVYTHKELGPQRFLTRQGRVHGRVSASWANEFNMLLRVPLEH